MIGIGISPMFQDLAVGNLEIPTNLTLTRVSGGVKIDWLGINQTEIYGKNDNGEYLLIYTAAIGLTTYTDIVDPVSLRYYKARSKSGSTYSEFCNEKSIALLGYERITNGTFDTNTNGWTALDNAVLSVDSQRLKVSVNVEGSWSKVEQMVATDIGSTFQLSIKGTNGTGAGSVRVGSGSTGSDLLTSTNIPNNDYTFQFVAVSGTSYISLSAGNSNILNNNSFYDNVSIKRVLPPLAEERITNGTFDTNTNGWTALDNAVLSVDSQRLKVSVNVEGSWSKVEQMVITEVGKTYELSLSSTNGTGAGSVRVGSGSTGSDLFTSTNIPMGTYSFRFVATSTNAYITLSAGNSNILNNNSFYDNVSVRRLLPLNAPP